MTLEKIVIIGTRNDLHKNIQPLTKQLFSADDFQEADSVIDRAQPNLIILDNSIQRSHIQTFLKSSKQDIPKIILSTQPENFSEFEKAGQCNCLCPDTQIDQLKNIISDLFNQPAKTNNQDHLSEFFLENLPPEIEMAGKSPAARRTIKLIEIIAHSQCNPVLIVGETGTGKELAAKAIHTIRHGSSKNFVAINCAALTANLLESELFGHEKGSFTGAEKEKTGLIEIAENGTIFLDEISEMPLELQAKLLRVIQEKTFRKVGGIKDLKTNATIIASSNLNLAEEAKNKKFRIDLYYRLSVCPVTLSPLKSPQRQEDILTLAQYFLNISDICPEKTGKIKGFTKLAEKALTQHDWPGNVRELKNVIDRAILLETTDKIGLSNLMLYPENIFEGDEQSAVSSLTDFSLEKAEKELISRALKETNWQKTQAASLLGITRATLYAKVKQYNISQAANPQTAASV